jgi:hypothetical protein
MDRPPYPAAAFPGPSSARAIRSTGRQLALPLPTVAPLASHPTAAPPPPAVPICPGQVWAGRPSTAQAQVHRILRHVFEEVVSDECRSGQP